MTEAPSTERPQTLARLLAGLENPVLARRAFQEALARHRYWHVLPPDGDEPSARYDARTGLRHPLGAEERLRAFLAAHPFLYLLDAEDRRLATLHTATGLLWWNLGDLGLLGVENAQRMLSTEKKAGLRGWRLPSREELRAFATAAGNPHRRGQPYRLATPGGEEACYWLCDRGRVDVDEGCWGVEGSWKGRVFACHDGLAGAEDLMAALAEEGRRLAAPGGEARFDVSDDARWRGLDARGLLAALAETGERLTPVDPGGKKAPLVFPAPEDGDAGSAEERLALLDWRPSRLPRLEPAQLHDPHKGLWELWGLPAEELRALRLVARDPARDLRPHPVAIDFGTSSTVVAVHDGRGPELLRVGARDYYAPLAPRDLENPTVIECLDFEAFRAAWGAGAYRPAHDWDWMRVGHEARAAWRDNPGDPRVLAAILPRLKQWALRAPAEAPLRLTDRESGREIEIPPPTDRRPARGRPIEVRPEDPFDPIEFYAWQLGMAINWRGRGLFRRYYLSFPVKYPRAARDRILAGFARGLQRSLPATLVDQGRVLNDFVVQELASEPAAYAAAALHHLGLEPGDGGLAYAVFDFGGGTADFDYGLWR